MQFGTGAAGASVAHHPKVVLFVAVNNVDVGIEIHTAKEGRPDVPGLLIAARRIAERRIGLVDCGVEALRREFPATDDEFPRPFDGFFFEIIAEGPISEHLEKGVVVGV